MCVIQSCYQPEISKRGFCEEHKGFFDEDDFPVCNKCGVMFNSYPGSDKSKKCRHCNVPLIRQKKTKK
jgi:hypothetical protein